MVTFMAHVYTIQLHGACGTLWVSHTSDCAGDGLRDRDSGPSLPGKLLRPPPPLPAPAPAGDGALISIEAYLQMYFHVYVCVYIYTYMYMYVYVYMVPPELSTRLGVNSAEPLTCLPV